jgi:hypothetical protein
VHPALPIIAGCNTAPIILVVAALYCKYYYSYIAHSASPVVPELSYKLGSIGWKRKSDEITMKSK